MGQTPVLGAYGKETEERIMAWGRGELKVSHSARWEG